MAIDRLSRGRWKVTVDVGTNGDRRRVSRTITGSRRAAERLERDLEAMRDDRGVDPFAVATVTVAEVVDRYIAQNAHRWRPNTITGYGKKLDNVIRPAWGTLRVAELDPRALEADYRALERGQRVRDLTPRRPFSPVTIGNAHKLLSAACADALRDRVIAADPMPGVRGPAGKPRRSITRTPDEEIRAVVQAARNRADDDLVDIVELAIATSARQGELCAIRWRDVTLTTGVLELNATASRYRGELVRVPGLKRGVPSRVLTVDEHCRRMLEDRFRRHVEQAERDGIPVDALDDVAVCSRTLESDATSPIAMGHRWRRAAAAAPSALRFHDLRHFAVTTMLDRGLSPRDTADRAGHSSPKMTLDVYSHATVASDERARDALGAAWSRITGATVVDELEAVVAGVLEDYGIDRAGLVDELVAAVRRSVAPGR